MKKTITLLILIYSFVYLGINLMAGQTQFPQFYTDKNQYFSFIPPEGWTKKDFPDDPRSKVIFTFFDNDTKTKAALVMIAYQVDMPRSMKSLSSFLNNRLSTLRNQTQCITSPLQEIIIADTKCLTAEVFINDTKSMIITGYPYGAICLDITYTASVLAYNKYLPVILDSLQTFIALKGVTERNESLIQAQNRVWLRKEALLLLSEKKYSQAIELLKPIAQQQTDDSDLCFQLGLAYQGTGQYEPALLYFNKAVEIKPRFWEAYFQIGAVYKKLDKLTFAEQSFRKAYELNPQSLESALNLAAILRRTNRAKEAISIYYNLRKDHPNNLAVIFNMGRAYFELNKLKKAQQCYQDCMTLNPDDPNVLLNLAVCYVALGEYRQAEILCNSALQIDKSLQKAHKLLDQINRKISR